MTKEDTRRVARNGWGWFVVCVWICGVPQVLKYTVMGIKMASQSTMCTLNESYCGNRQDAPKDKGDSEISDYEAIKALTDKNPDMDVKLVPKKGR